MKVRDRLAASADLGWGDVPHPIRGPFVRWPRTADAVLGLTVFVVTLAAVALSELAEGESFTVGSVTDLPVAAVALIAGSSTALLWRRTRPLTVLSIVLGSMIVWSSVGYGDGNDLPMVIAAYAVGRYGSDRRWSLIVIVVAVAVSVLGTVVDPDQRIDVLPAVVLPLVPWYVGGRVRNRIDYLALLRDRAERVEAEEQHRIRQAASDERARIARELHDVVAHRVSMMTVQAGAAKTVARVDVDAAVEAMTDVEHAGREALSELRHLLGVLRPDGDAGELLPQRGLADVPALVEELEHTGTTVALVIDDDLPDVPAAVGLSAYRIVQEALTNVVKHTQPGAAVSLAVRAVGDDVVIDVVNDLDAPAAAADLPASGFGLTGMRERVLSLGGDVEAGPSDDGTFEVHVRLPVVQGEP